MGEQRSRVAVEFERGQNLQDEKLAGATMLIFANDIEVKFEFLLEQISLSPFAATDLQDDAEAFGFWVFWVENERTVLRL